jgi:hypothetical protein
MNRQRRKRLEEAISKIEELQAEIQSIAEEERESFDNMPESLQDGERGQQISDNADSLDMADSDFDSLLDTLREVI